MTNSEWMLVGQAKKGDADAFARLYEKYYKDLYRFAYCLLRGSYAAEDAVSSAVLKAYEKLPELRKDSSFKNWLFQITARECRSQQRKPSLYLEDSTWQEPSGTEQGYLKPEIRELLDLLSDEERRIITLNVFGGYNSREIATVLHKKEGSVRSIKSRSFARLRQYLTAENQRKDV